MVNRSMLIARMAKQIILIVLSILFASPLYAAIHCPNGTYHLDGKCRQCPVDGTYIQGTKCGLVLVSSIVADNGIEPMSSPSAIFIHNIGFFALCPDGKYYRGRFCTRLPSGRYTGTSDF